MSAEQLAYIPTNTSDYSYHPAPSESMFLEEYNDPEPINFVQRKVRKLVNEMFSSEEERNPLAVARFRELMEKSFTSLAIDGNPFQTNTEDTVKTNTRIKRLNELRETFYLVYPDMRERDRKKKSGYDIVADVLNVEELYGAIEDLSPEKQAEKIQLFKESKLLDWQTLFGEMYNAHDKTTRFDMKNGHLYFYPLSREKPFDETMAFFVALSENNGTNESRRHFEELYTYIEIGLWAQQAEEGEQYAMASSEGIAEGTRYENDYVDVGELKVDKLTGERYVEITRFKSALTHEQFRRILEGENPNYFIGREDIPIDAAEFKPLFFPKGRFTSNHHLYDTVFHRHPDAIDEAVMLHEIYKPCIPVITEYIERLCNFTNWTDLVNAFDGALKESRKANIAFQNKLKTGEITIYDPTYTTSLFVYDANQRAGEYVIQQLKQEADFEGGAGCGSIGTVGGFTVEAIMHAVNVVSLMEQATTQAIISNSVAQESLGDDLELSDSMGSRRIVCPACGYDGKFNIRPINGFLSACGNPIPRGCPNRAAVVCTSSMPEENKQEEAIQNEENEEKTERHQSINDVQENVLLVNFDGQEVETDETPIAT